MFPKYEVRPNLKINLPPPETTENIEHQVREKNMLIWNVSQTFRAIGK